MAGNGVHGIDVAIVATDDHDETGMVLSAHPPSFRLMTRLRLSPRTPTPVPGPNALLRELDDMERTPLETLDRDALNQMLRRYEELRVSLESLSLTILFEQVGRAARGCPGFRSASNEMDAPRA